MNKIEIIPLGGIGEFGMNCMGIRYGGEMIVIDAGMGFPEETPYGVDICVPDFDALEEYRDELIALFLTHGHEDHIGATPFFLKQFDIPVYGSRLTLAFVDEKLKEHKLIDWVETHRVAANDVVKVGPFEVEFIHASHSLVDCFSLAIKTPEGTLIHTGDYKIDDSPVIGKPYDLKTLSRYGEEGVLALLGDSTNATVPGRTPSEKAVIPALEEIIADARGRIFVTTFSSSFHRLQIVFDLASQLGKKVCVLGRSMMRNVELAERLNLLKIPPNTAIDLTNARALADDDIVYLVTGSQGEQRAVTWNLATGSYKGLEIQEGDTVVLSARIIPGNEKRISKMIGAIYRRGGLIIEEKRRLIHVSGHAAQEDIRIMTETAKPKFVVPIHGEYRMLFRHKEFIKNHLGYRDENIVLIENGDVLELDSQSAKVVERRDIGRTFIDQSGFGEVESATVRERKRLASAGIVMVFVSTDRTTGALGLKPIIELSGVNGIHSNNGNLEAMREGLVGIINGLSKAHSKNQQVIIEKLELFVRRYVKNATATKPTVVVKIIENH